MTRTPMLERNDDKYVPKFKEQHTSTGGRVYGIKKVPQTAMFEITGEGAGDLPEALKGRFTSTGRAERSLKTYLHSQKLMLEALEAKQAIPTPMMVEKDPTEVAKDPTETSKVPITAKTDTKSD